MSIKILLADDSITIQKVIGIIFGGEDYALTVVDNGKAAVEKASEISPDVLLIDALMPGMSGYEVCEAVRATPALSTKPILILTGSFEPFDEAKAKSCGADDFLAKPFESQQIVAKVKQLYELGESRASTPAQPEPAPVGSPVIPTSETPLVTEPAQEINNDDIWGAFTAEPELTSAPDQPATPGSSFEPDVFAIVNEESEMQIAQPQAASAAETDGTGSQWIPVEEHTFEFKEETVSDLPTAALSGQAPSLTEITFGDIAFEEEHLHEEAAPIAEPATIEVPVEPAFAEPAPFFTETVIPSFTETNASAFSVPAADHTKPAAQIIPQAGLASSPGTLTEEQLRSVIAGVSQEVIQRIVWEVVPDLAEILIKEAINKIKEGL
jgi:CheY-like chemotaxis protein